MTHRISVGEPFPGPVPPHEGAVLEIGAGGPVVLIEMPGCSRDERLAFGRTFRRYALWQPPAPVPMAVWAFDFPTPHGPIDCSYNARRMVETNRQNILADYLDTSAGVKNLWLFVLLDGKTVKGIKYVGLDRQAIEQFQGIIRNQLAADYTRQTFDQALLQVVYPHKAPAILEMGTGYRHDPKRVVGSPERPTRHRGKKGKRR